MSNFIFYYPEIDRQQATFDLRFEYGIDPYVDSEGEVHDSTRWSFDVAYDSGATTHDGGNEGPRSTLFMDLGLADTGTIVGYTATFHAVNDVSGESVDQVLRVLDATSVTASVRLAGGALEEFLLGGSGDDTAVGRGGRDYLDGGDGDDRLTGGGGGDTLIGGAGSNILTGGRGSDDYWIDSVADTAIEVADEGGEDRVFASVNWTLGEGFEALILVDGATRGIGNALDNTIVGTWYANRLEGGGGADILDGGTGSDVLIGGDGDDRLDGGSNDDRMTGGAGDDTYFADSDGKRSDDTDGDRVIEKADQGTDTVVVGSEISRYTLGANVENLEAGYHTGRRFEGIGNALNNTLTGSTSSVTNRLFGRGGDDRLIGSFRDDTLVGGAGADTFEGGIGIDVVDYSGATGAVRLDAGTAGRRGEAKGDVFDGIERFIGSDFDDVLFGASASERIDGGAGDDLLRGGGGNNTLIGGAGSDAFRMIGETASDRIMDFDLDGGDVIQIRAGKAFDTFEEIIAAARAFGPDGGSTLFTLSDSASFVLVGVAVDSLGADDFTFS